MDFAIWTIITIVIVLAIAGMLPKQRERRKYSRDDMDDEDVLIIEIMDD